MKKILLLYSLSFFCRSPEVRFEGIHYFGLDGERDLMETLEASYTIIKSVIKQVS